MSRDDPQGQPGSSRPSAPVGRLRMEESWHSSSASSSAPASMTIAQGNLLNGPNGLNGRGYFDSRGFLIRGGRGIAVENDFAAGSGPARQARARLHAVVDPEPDRRIALVWAARNEGGLFS